MAAGLPPEEWPSCPPRDHGRRLTGDRLGHDRITDEQRRAAAAGAGRRSTDPIATATGLARAAAALAAGSGPVAVDAERASGYRYSQRAYLVQLRRAGVGTVLIDPLPIGISGFGPLADIVNETEWILHAAPQVLPCLAELGLRPARLFDTELAGRLLGDGRALGTMVEQWLDVRLEKRRIRPPTGALAHSPVNGSPTPRLTSSCSSRSTRSLAAQLADAGKVEWAAEFEAIRAARPAAPRDDPWRRTSGLQSEPAGSSQSSDRCGTRAICGPPSGM